MEEQMKVMIAYDGSKHADLAIDDAARAGLPHDSEVLVATVADLSANSPAVSEFALLSAASRRVEAVLAKEERVFKEAENLASKAVERLRRRFPEWKVRYDILRGQPADELLRKAAQWKPDLIIGGSQGRSAIGRFFLGSVSRKVAEEARCAVRVVRRGFERTEAEPVKIILGAGDLANAERLVEAVAGRAWTAGTRVRLVAVDDGVSAGRISAVYPYAKAIFEQSAELLAADGLQVSVEVESGDPKTALLAAAADEAWRADAIFVVAKSAENGQGLDEMAAGLITGAKCTIEIVR